ncbi:MAG: hypothetical protein JW732_01705 [Dehalococcoidia bacterium]|nr:hypothetical protein [Dehalococcoidia bacterium]
MPPKNICAIITAMKLLKAALEKQDYNLAAHVLVYGLMKAQVKYPNFSSKFLGHRDYYGKKNDKRQRRKE